MACIRGGFDPTQTALTIEIWTARQADVTVLGFNRQFPRFDLPRTSDQRDLSGRAWPGNPGSWARSCPHNRGSNFVVRDETGQVVVSTVQMQRMPVGTEVDALGRVAFGNAQWVLRSGLVRVAQLPPVSLRAQPAPPGRVD